MSGPWRASKGCGRAGVCAPGAELVRPKIIGDASALCDETRASNGVLTCQTCHVSRTQQTRRRTDRKCNGHGECYHSSVCVRRHNTPKPFACLACVVRGAAERVEASASYFITRAMRIFSLGVVCGALPALCCATCNLSKIRIFFFVDDRVFGQMLASHTDAHNETSPLINFQKNRCPAAPPTPASSLSGACGSTRTSSRRRQRFVRSVLPPHLSRKSKTFTPLTCLCCRCHVCLMAWSRGSASTLTAADATP